MIMNNEKILELAVKIDTFDYDYDVYDYKDKYDTREDHIEEIYSLLSNNEEDVILDWLKNIDDEGHEERIRSLYNEVLSIKKLHLKRNIGSNRKGKLMSINIILGNNIKKYRLLMNFTRKDLAQKIGVTESTVSRYESNERTPNLKILKSIADALGVTINDLINNIENNMIDENVSIGDKIKEYREIINITQKDLAEKSGLSESAIKYYETNKRNPKLETLSKIAEALGISINDLIIREEYKLIERVEKVESDEEDKIILNLVKYYNKEFYNNKYDIDKFDDEHMQDFKIMLNSIVKASLRDCIK